MLLRFCSRCWRKSFGKIRCFATKSFILGIETSCDDTGIAVVDESGRICGESLISQQTLSTRFGGVIPFLAAKQHAFNLPVAYEEVLKLSRLNPKDIDAVAVTVEPGIVLSLKEGASFALNLCKSLRIPLIKVHHMQAHALTPVYTNNIEYPYLCLLISGGHALTVWVKSSKDFIILGRNIDNAPGEVLDKVARRLKLVNLNSEYVTLSGGALIEKFTKDGGDPFGVKISHPMASVLDCNFSFCGILTNCYWQIEKFELQFGIAGGTVLPNCRDFAASVQHAVFSHLASRLMRAFEYVKMKQWGTGESGYPKYLVASGGVASNSYIRKGLELLTSHYGFSAVFPPAKYCTDNGVMIAWNGLEKWKIDDPDIIRDLPDDLYVNAKVPIGEDFTADVGTQRLRRRVFPLWRSFNLERNFYSECSENTSNNNSVDDSSNFVSKKDAV